MAEAFSADRDDWGCSSRDRPLGSIPEVPQGVGPESQIKRLVMSKGPPPTTKLPLVGAGIETVTTDCSESTTALQSCPFRDKVRNLQGGGRGGPNTTRVDAG